MKKKLLFLFVIVIALSACSSVDEQATNTTTFTPLPTNTQIPTATQTQIPSETPTPTKTPKPTRTATPIPIQITSAEEFAGKFHVPIPDRFTALAGVNAIFHFLPDGTFFYGHETGLDENGVLVDYTIAGIWRMENNLLIVTDTELAGGWRCKYDTEGSYEVYYVSSNKELIRFVPIDEPCSDWGGVPSRRYHFNGVLWIIGPPPENE